MCHTITVLLWIQRDRHCSAEQIRRLPDETKKFQIFDSESGLRLIVTGRIQIWKMNDIMGLLNQWNCVTIKEGGWGDVQGTTWIPQSTTHIGCKYPQQHWIQGEAIQLFVVRSKAILLFLIRQSRNKEK